MKSSVGVVLFTLLGLPCAAQQLDTSQNTAPLPTHQESIVVTGTFQYIDWSNSQRIALGYTGIYGAPDSSNALQSKYVREYPVHRVTASWLGRGPATTQLRTQLGVTQRYGRGADPILDISTMRSFGHFTPYLRLANAMNTGYEEIKGVPMPGRSVMVGLSIQFDRKK